MIGEILWPAVATGLILRLEVVIQQWFKLKEPLSDAQYRELRMEIDRVQKQLAEFTLRKHYEE